MIGACQHDMVVNSGLPEISPGCHVTYQGLEQYANLPQNVLNFRKFAFLYAHVMQIIIAIPYQTFMLISTVVRI